jgi:hypothetical protein
VAIRYGFFDSLNGDRKYPASWFNEYWQGIIGSGVVMANNSAALQVVSNDNMTVTVKSGKFIFESGHWIVNDNDLVLSVPTADVLLPRIDAVVVVLRADEPNRAVDIIYRQGVAASIPQEPPADPTATDEFVLAWVNVGANVTIIPTSAITDRRVRVAVLADHVDISTLFQQYQDGLLSKMMFRRLTSYYKTTTANQATIPINIPLFEPAVDIIEVYITGFRREEIKYAVDSAGESLTLLPPVTVVGTEIEIVVWHFIDPEGLLPVIDTLNAQIQDLIARVETLESRGV